MPHNFDSMSLDDINALPTETINAMSPDEQVYLFARVSDLMAEAQRPPKPDVTHIRKKAGHSLGNQYYSHAHRAQFAGDYHDPMAETLCGADATIEDMSWAETRFAKNREFVSCPTCVEVRLDDHKALR